MWELTIISSRLSVRNVYKSGDRIGDNLVLRNMGAGYLRCQCKCGKWFEKRTNNIVSSPSVGCGCGDKRTSDHEDYGKPEYKIWSSMKHRCKNHKDYAGRGITYCERWEYYSNFIADMGYRPADNYWLERVDNDGPYSPDNCIWDTTTNQMNNRRGVRVISVNGKDTTFQELSRETGLTMQMLSIRYSKGDRDERLIRPRDNRGRKSKKREPIFPFLRYIDRG